MAVVVETGSSRVWFGDTEAGVEGKVRRKHTMPVTEAHGVSRSVCFCLLRMWQEMPQGMLALPEEMTTV